MIDEEGRLKRIDYSDRVYFDSVLGIAGTTYPIGTAEMPSDVVANAVAICVAQNINKIHVTGTLAIGTGIAQDLVGHNSILTAQTAGAAYVREFSGYLEIDAMVGGTLDIYANGADITINADCIGTGVINIYGIARVTDNHGAGTTVNDYTESAVFSAGLANMLDLAGGGESVLLMTGAEQTLYEETDTTAFFFAGLKIDWTGLNFGGGEDTSIRFYEMVDGTNYRLVSTEVLLNAALPAPVITSHPRNANTDIQPTPGYYRQGVKITAQQAAVGVGWNTLTYCSIDAKRG